MFWKLELQRKNESKGAKWCIIPLVECFWTHVFEVGTAENFVKTDDFKKCHANLFCSKSGILYLI